MYFFFCKISQQSIIQSFDKVIGYTAGVIILGEKLHWLSVIGACEIWAGLLVICSVCFHEILGFFIKRIMLIIFWKQEGR